MFKELVIKSKIKALCLIIFAVVISLIFLAFLYISSYIGFRTPLHERIYFFSMLFSYIFLNYLLAEKFDGYEKLFFYFAFIFTSFLILVLFILDFLFRIKYTI